MWSEGVRMFVERLELVDFRSYVRADVPMAAGATTFIGSNGQGLSLIHI